MFKKMTLTMMVLVMPLLPGRSYGDPVNILTNPGFESGTTGWSAFGGTFSTVSSSPFPHGGSLSGKLTGRTNTWNGIQQNVLGKMSVGQTYNVSGWVRTDSPNATMKLTFAKTDGDGNSWAQGAIGDANNTGWTYISGTYTLTASGTITSLKFYVESSDLNNIYIDDANIIQSSPPTVIDASGNVNANVSHQKLEGFGAAVAWYEGWLEAIPEPSRTNIYNTLFRDLGLDIYRVRNTYDYDSAYMSRTGTIISKALVRNPNLKILCSSWSPPTYLKSTGALDSGTLIGGPSNYNYTGFATWWADSITAWAGYGVNLDYVSIQNEPEYNGNDRCLFNPTQNSTYAGYNQAFEAVWQEFNSRWGSSMPKMIGPEAISWNGTKSYINALVDINHAYGFANHYYGCGDYESPDTFISGMTDFGTNYGYKPLFQTEYEKLSGANGDFSFAMDMALIMHNGLVYEELSSYFHWTLFWAQDSNSLVSLPSYGSSNYVINPNYYAFKHFANFTDPGWYRVDANTTSSNLRISAYKNPYDTNLAVVIINTFSTTDVNLTLSLNGFAFAKTVNEIYRSTSSSSWINTGTFYSGQPLLIPAQSITTIHLATYDTCAAVQTNGYMLESDLNGDCYVDFDDFELIADNWLHTDCGDENNWCDWADYWTADGTVDFADISGFAPLWRQCNNPQDANCTPSW